MVEWFGRLVFFRWFRNGLKKRNSSVNERFPFFFLQLLIFKAQKKKRKSRLTRRISLDFPYWRCSTTEHFWFLSFQFAGRFSTPSATD